MKINTNLSSLIVQSGLKASTNGLNTAIERMTTGFKINHAKDNAANYSINTKLSSKLSSYYAAQDNASMGLDMMTSAMENLDLISSHLSRIRNLAEQAANGTYSGESLRAIQSEVAARLAEGQRIIQNSNYNGIQLFQAPEKESESKFIKEVVRLSEEEALAQGYTLIKTADELQAMQDNLSGKYILMNDIDLAGYDWTAVGTYDNPFAGEFNGNGYVISNLTINEPTKQFQGLFGVGDARTSYSNVGLENVDIKGQRDIGALIGRFDTSISVSNCYSTGSVTGIERVGGLVGDSYKGAVTNCYSTCNVKGTSDTGGLIGYNFGVTVSNCYASGDVTGKYRVGGLIGYSSLGPSNCYASGNVFGETNVGGLLGEAFYRFSNCYATGNVTGTTNVGGLVGNSKAYGFDYSYSTGSVSGKENVGGLIGYNDTGSSNTALIKNSYSLSKVTGEINTGALIGYLESVRNMENISYNTSINPRLTAIGYNKAGIDETLIKNDFPIPKVPVLPNIITFQIGIASGDSSQMSFDLEFTLDLSIEISDSESARKALNQIDELMAKINQRQTEFGSAYNRLESALETIGVHIDNLTSTQSTIRDADIAEESSAYIRNQILQQASATLLATANQTPAIAMQLL